MKKIFPYLLLVLALGLGVYSLLQGWAGLDLPIAGITMKKLGYEFLQGKLALGGLLLGTVLFFLRPKLSGLGGLIAIIGGAWMVLMPPIIEDNQWQTEKIVYAMVAAGVLIAIAGLLVPGPQKS